MRITGASGQIRVGGRVAVQLGRWSFTGDSTAWTLESDPVSIDDFWFDSGYPKELRLDIGDLVWRWQDVTVSGREPLKVSGTGRHEVL